MKYSASAIELTVQAETGNGVPPRGVFLNENGKPSMGFGHLVSKLDRVKPPITMEQAYRMLNHDLTIVSEWLASEVHGINQNQFDAVVCLGYQALNGRVTTLDRQRLTKSNILGFLKNKQLALASAEFSRWVFSPEFSHQNVLRRSREQFLFDTPWEPSY